MDKDDNFKRKYCAQMDHLISSGYARKILKTSDEHPRSWYLTHFGVFHPNKLQKIRLVFDGAAKTGGTSLNENLLTGPDLTNSLLGVLIRFRQKKIAIIGDIREMFLQIKIREEDRCAQKFLWRGKNRCEEPETYEMTSMIFGSASSPYTAQYIMRRNALEFESSNPVAVNAILRKHYVDDYLDSFDDEEEAINCITDVSSIQQRAGFELRNWASNSASLLKKLSETFQNEKNIDLVPEEKVFEKILGLKWNPSTDTISFALNLTRIPKNILEGCTRPTKREMLRVLMSVFDPLGMLSPVVIRGKMLLQSTWRSGIGWDQKLKDQEFLNWREWMSTVRELQDYGIPRSLIKSQNKQTISQLHLFSDASEKAYSAVAYLRTRDEHGHAKVSFLAGKARVAPLKPVSIPQMELQGALLASRLGDTLQKELEIKIEKRFFWTDSRTVLSWIRSDPRRYQTFVAHRLGKIDVLTNVEEWRWVPSKQNTADCATKDTGKMDKLVGRWLDGPEFLAREEINWPKATWEDSEQSTVEVRKEFTASIQLRKVYETPKIENFSKWICLLRSTAIVLELARMWRGCRPKEITAEDLIKSEKHLIKRVQQECFSEEIQDLKRGKTVASKSRIHNLSPYIAEDEVLKIDGRVKEVKGIPECVRLPIILDGKHHFTRLLVQHYHVRFHHGSTETVVNELKQKYWIIKIRPTVRLVASRCQMCRLRFAKPEQPRMGDLPQARLGHHCRAFSFTGLDYFGPMYVTVKRSHEKRWGAIFTCLTTRAVHLELASSLSTDSAIMALRRMINRRGTPEELHSDNGTNFVGVNQELKEAIQSIDQEKYKEELTKKGIKWKFNPPSAPHMGGTWERLVGSVKRALMTILNEKYPKEEVLTTLLTEVENTINSRPLTNVSVDPRDPESLTPNHFLIGSSSGSPACGQFSLTDLQGRRQWRISQQLADMFWTRSLKEYLPSLIVRKQWNQESRNIKIGDIVLIVDPNAQRNSWPKGKVTQVFPGKDRRVRVVEVLTRGKLLKRATNKLVVLVAMQ